MIFTGAFAVGLLGLFMGGLAAHLGLKLNCAFLLVHIGLIGLAGHLNISY
jgi:hypothetical protein